MRMKELAERTGLPRTTIHHYLREGLLPPPRRTSRNAAEYGEEHVERLRLVAALRSRELGPFPVDGVRGVLAYVERGVAPEAAAGLYRALGPPQDGEAPRLTVEDVASRAGVEPRRVREWSAAGLLVPRGAGTAPSYDETDVGMARLYAELLASTGLAARDLVPFADMVREAAAYERTLADLARRARGGAGERSAELVSRALEGMYRYLRIREREPAAR